MRQLPKVDHGIQTLAGNPKLPTVREKASEKSLTFEMPGMLDGSTILGCAERLLMWPTARHRKSCSKMLMSWIPIPMRFMSRGFLLSFSMPRGSLKLKCFETLDNGTWLSAQYPDPHPSEIR